MAADTPTFTVTPDYDIGQINIAFVKDEWKHLEDHDEALVHLEPVILPFLHQQMLDRTLDVLRASIHGQLHHWVRAGTIYYLFNSMWIWEELEKERRKINELERMAKWQLR